MVLSRFVSRFAVAFIAAISMLSSARAAETVSIADFGAVPNDHRDAAPAVRAALEHCKAAKAAKLVFPPGRYDFWPERAVERYMFVSNDDESLKRIAFDLAGMDNLEIDGQGAQFIFHNYIVPFATDHSSHITLSNFSIDWTRSFHSEALIVAVNEDSVDLDIPEQFTYKIDNGILVFTGEDKTEFPMGGLLEYDPRKHETAYMAVDYWNGGHLRATSTGPHQIRLMVKIKATPRNVLTFGHGQRMCPAFVISDSRQIAWRNVTIHHSNGMGILAQRSSDLDLDRVQVTPPADGSRVVSLTADATHFANCSGHLTMTDCLFENQLDDATNIHGIYVQITRKISATSVEIKLVHPQQFGFDIVQPGDAIEFVHCDSMNTFGKANVKSARRLNKEYMELEFDAPMPPDLKIKDVIASTKGYPDVTIRGCTIRGNRARGFLLGSRGKILLENNTFHTAGAALLLEGDARFWFEQAGVRDLTIRHNRFEDCNYGTWGKATIEVGAGIEAAVRNTSRYNRNILIEDNTFHTFNGPLVRGYSIDGITIRNNHIEPSTAYPAKDPDAKPFDFTDSQNITIKDNDIVK